MGLLPYNMASEFGEEERKCACASPLFWWSLVAPAMSSRPAVITASQCETFFGLPGCVTRFPRPLLIFFNTFLRFTGCSYMLNVVKRGQENEMGDDAPPHHFLFHAELVLIIQCFSLYFKNLPVGGRFSNTGHTLQCATPKSPGCAYPVITQQLNYQHRICFLIIAGLTARDRLYAHTRIASGIDAGPTGRIVDAPAQIGGGGTEAAPYARVSLNPNRNTPPFAVE